uniref:L-aminoadipate-semialdehyde dehydrogenase-phosphopantetheinyl transferase-like n=1 Tax=Erigeron canadensis TaxID=72917 RepID=UPI001CB95A9A|nr:L-aminoadipate-semialdehyde dehydrogenase-phosphopantetheinyl transferase-like [Erigeron canadensis]
MEKGVQRWLVNISKWNPTQTDFSTAISLLPSHEHSCITRFVKIEDRKRALVSRLLQYALVHQLIGIPFHEILIDRTPHGKPYLENHEKNVEFPNFNFNVSHHGDYVAIASEPICIVGLDIVSCFLPGKETVSEFIRNFSSYFSNSEWEDIVNAGSDDNILDVFFRYWCLKEAFVKALGVGVGYKLDYVEFHHKDWTNIYVKVDGDTLKDWNFWLFELQGRHRVAVARGHPKMANESYKRTLKQTHFDNDLYKLGFHLANPSFVTRTVEEVCSLLPRTELNAQTHT